MKKKKNRPDDHFGHLGDPFFTESIIMPVRKPALFYYGFSKKSNSTTANSSTVKKTNFEITISFQKKSHTIPEIVRKDKLLEVTQNVD